MTNTAASPDSRLFVLVVDDLHIMESDLIPVKRVMTDFFDALAPDDEVAVVFIGHSNLGVNFTTDRTTLRRTADSVRAALGFGLDALGRSANASANGDAFMMDGKIVHDFAVTADQTLANVARALAGSTHARRAIVYVTAGSVAPTTPDLSKDPMLTDFDDLVALYDTARRANVPIYTLDPRGLTLPEDAVRGGASVVGQPAVRSSIAENIRYQQHRLAENAINTGGRAFTNQSDLTQAVRAIVADNGSYYLLGYYPSPFEADGKYHTFDVTVKRPGLRVRPRAGYVASSASPAEAEMRPMLEATMRTGVNVSGVALRATALPLLPGASGMQTLVTVEVTYPLPPDGSGAIDDSLEMSVLALDPDANVKAQAGRAFGFSRAGRATGAVTLLVDQVIELPPEPLTLRVGVTSRVLGRAGSVQLPVDVPKPSDGKLQVSGLAIGVVGDRTLAVNGAVAGPLLPFQPLTAREFAASDTLRVFGRVWWKSRGAPVVTMAIRLLSGGAPPAAVQPALTTADGVGGGKLMTLDQAVPLSGLAPGDYVLEVSARLGKDRPITRAVPFRVR
ncbi:MAG: VWA domain-containing protein [Vicinamibacterales bacterium]